MEDPSVGVEPTGFSGAGGAVSPHGLQLAEEGGQPAKPLKAPAKPTAEMIAMHEISHIPFRAWCPHCVRGRGKSFQHRRVDHSQDDKDHPVVSIDYAFFGAPGELPADAVGGQKMPVLVVRDRFTKSLFSHLVPAKGVEHFYPEAALLRDIKFLGYTKLTLKSDQEPSILALANAVRNTLSSQNIECQLESSPKGDAHGMSNGEAESSVGIAQGLTRTLKDHIEHKTGQLLDPKSPLLSWMIEYVGVLYTLFSYDEHSQDGITPFRKVKGRDWQLALPVFGECVDYRVKTVHKLEARWDSGIFLGIRLNTTEKIIGTPKGVVVVQSVRRKPEDQQWNAELIKSLVGTPWAPSPEKAKKPQEALELPEPVSIEAEQPSVEVDTSVAEMKPHYRRVYLLQPDFEKFGYSATCKACNALRLGFDRQGLNHSEECRLRIVQRLQETEYGRKRIEIARKREVEAKKSLEAKKSESKPVVPTPKPSAKSVAVPEVKKVRVQEAGPSQEAIPTPAPSSGSGLKRPAEDPPQDPRLEEVETREARGQKRSAEEADVSTEMEVTHFLLGQRSGFLGVAQAKLHDNPEWRPVCEEQFDIEPEAPQYWDNISGKPLDTALVQAARKEECDVITSMGVWEVIDRPPGEKVITTRWVDVNKGDEIKKKYRSRLVARELKLKSDIPGSDSWKDFFASMPPITALRMLFTLAVTGRIPDAEGKLRPMPKDTCLIFIDIKKAHFWSPARRRLLVELPEGMGFPPGKVGLLKKSLYGTRDAPANWEAAIKEVMLSIGFLQARSNSCLYYHPEKQIRLEVHGDDFTGVGAKSELQWLADSLKKHWTIELRGILGPPNMPDVDHSIVILNRLLTWTDQGIELEADPRHVEILLREVGCEGSKVTTPLVKERVEEALESEDLSEDMIGMYRSASMRLAYLSQDRPDLLVLGKELAKGLKRPTQAHFQMLKRGVRYLRAFPRLIHLFPNQSQFTQLELWVDADHAGCIRSRKSTTGTVLQLGKATVRTTCKSQAVIALSSGEAEYYGLVSGLCQALGEQSTLKDWGIHVPIVGYMDATTGLAIGSRHGLGKVKHIDTVFLWAQQVVIDGKAKLYKKDTKDMLADLFTKPLDAQRSRMLLSRMNYNFSEGRHHLALSA